MIKERIAGGVRSALGCHWEADSQGQSGVLGVIISQSWEQRCVPVPQCLIAASSIRSHRHSLFLLCPDLCTEKQGKNTPAQVFWPCTLVKINQRFLMIPGSEDACGSYHYLGCWDQHVSARVGNFSSWGTLWPGLGGWHWHCWHGEHRSRNDKLRRGHRTAGRTGAPRALLPEAVPMLKASLLFPTLSQPGSR